MRIYHAVRYDIDGGSVAQGTQGMFYECMNGNSLQMSSFDLYKYVLISLALITTSRHYKFI